MFKEHSQDSCKDLPKEAEQATQGPQVSGKKGMFCRKVGLLLQECKVKGQGLRGILLSLRVPGLLQQGSLHSLGNQLFVANVEQRFSRDGDVQNLVAVMQCVWTAGKRLLN